MSNKNFPLHWIWIHKEPDQQDRKICFRKSIVTVNEIEKLELNIWADSRYYLWINGNFIGTGPSRCWPEAPRKDSYSVSPGFSSGIQIAVLVWHYGTSTSQYIHGPAGFAVEGVSIDNRGNREPFVSDASWRCRVHSGYFRPVPRINVSQPWLEMVDASVFPEGWMNPGFNDTDWGRAVIRGSMRLKSMPDRGIPLLSSCKRLPERMVKQHFLRCRGIGVRVDYKDAFYPSDTTTEDRMQTGYICCLIESPVKQGLTVTLADRLWPEIDEYIVLNGQRYIMTPGRRDITLSLEKRENLLLLDVSGARQRFTADLHFTAEHKISFSRPIPDCDALVAAIGPFETVEIGNIVCADGFVIDRENDEFIRAGRCRTKEDLSNFSTKLHPVNNSLFDGVKLRSLSAVVHDIQSQAVFSPETILMQASPAEGDHEMIFDMGVEVSGFLSFSVESAGNAEIDFRFFEYLASGVPEIPDDLDTSLRYLCASGRGEFRSLVRRGFRYIAIRSRAGTEVKISGLYVDEQLFPLERRGAFTSGDGVLDEIWCMCRRTVELCSEDSLVDSPAFEQAFWIGDAFVMALYHQYLFGDTELTRHSLMLTARSMDYAELPDCHLPAGVHLLLTAWAQLWILTGRDYWIHTADKVFLLELYPWLKKAADAFFDHIDATGLFSIDAWNMLDWAPMDTPYKGTVTHLNARLAACFRAISELAGILDLADDGMENRLKNYAERLASKTDEAFWDEALQCYIDCIHEDGTRSEVVSVQTNLMMLLYGCVPAEREERIRSFILTPPAYAVTPGSPFLAHFYYEYLFSIGQGEKALKGIREQWGPMLEHGTCWETFKGFYKDRLTRSYCHAWSSAPAYLFGAWILGIRPVKPGFEKILIAPVTSGLDSAEGVVPIPAGDIYISWVVEDRKLTCDVRLPRGTEWEFNPAEEGWDKSTIVVTEFDP